MTPELDWLFRRQLYSPNRVALTDGLSGRQWSFADFYLKTLKISQWLLQNGIHSGDKVALIAGNRLETFALFFALQRLRASLVPINTRLTAFETQKILHDCEPKMVIADADVQIESFALVLFDELVNASEKLPAAPVPFLGGMEDIPLILYTSGTTGAAKGAMLSNRMLLWNSHNTNLRLQITHDDRAVIFLPLFHTGGWNVLSLPFFHRGAEIILLPKFESSAVLRLTSEKNCTLLFGVPTTMRMMADDPQFPKLQFQSVRYAIVGGEPLPLNVIDAWQAKGVPIRQGYGLTEFGPNVFSLNEEHAREFRGSIGFPNFDVQAKVINSKGENCQANEVGELWLRGPMSFSGYLNNIAETEKAFSGEWVKTGDLVCFDEKGFFYVSGRKKDMFISGGENVYPAEIESVLGTHPEIKECAVLGVADAKWGEVGLAVVVGPQPSQLPQIEDFLRQHLAKFKNPKHFCILDSLPKTESGKIKKQALREQLSGGFEFRST